MILTKNNLEVMKMDGYMTNTNIAKSMDGIMIYNNETVTSVEDNLRNLVLAYQLGIPDPEVFINLNPEFFRDQTELYMSRDTPKKDGSGGGNQGNRGRGGCDDPKGGQRQGSGKGGGRNQGGGKGRNR